MTRPYCGGCHGQGSHWRWCPEVKGTLAAMLGENSERAEYIGDTVGANYPEAANAAYRLSGILRQRAEAEAKEFQRRNVRPVQQQEE